MSQTAGKSIPRNHRFHTLLHTHPFPNKSPPLPAKQSQEKSSLFRFQTEPHSSREVSWSLLGGPLRCVNFQLLPGPGQPKNLFDMGKILSPEKVPCSHTKDRIDAFLLLFSSFPKSKKTHIAPDTVVKSKNVFLERKWSKGWS